MSTYKDFDLDDGEKVRVEYDSKGRDKIKITFNSSGAIVGKAEYRYSTAKNLTEWKSYDGDGKLKGSFIGDVRGGAIVNVRESMDADWTIPKGSI